MAQLNQKRLGAIPARDTWLDYHAIEDRLKKCSTEHARIDCVNGDCDFHHTQGVYPLIKCGLRICPTCASYRQKRLFARYLPYASQINPAFLMTLTLRRHRPLSASRLRDLTHNMTVLLRRYRRPTKKRPAYLTKYIYALEPKHKHDGYHYHVHLIHDGSIIPRTILSRDWFSITRDSYIVDDKPISSANDLLDYVFKYICKPIRNATISDYIAIRGVRFIAHCGFEKLKKPVKKRCQHCNQPLTYLGKHEDSFSGSCLISKSNSSTTSTK